MHGGQEFKNQHYILLAEFDIDSGSRLITKYYPTVPLMASENVLAELMLPDGAHLRDEDCGRQVAAYSVEDETDVSITLNGTIIDIATACQTVDRRRSGLSSQYNTILHEIDLLSAEWTILPAAKSSTLDGHSVTFTNSYSGTIIRLIKCDSLLLNYLRLMESSIKPAASKSEAGSHLTPSKSIMQTHLMPPTLKRSSTSSSPSLRRSSIQLPIHGFSSLTVGGYDNLNNHNQSNNGNDIYYAINLVRGNSAKCAKPRTRVKAMAVVCPLPAVHVFKPLLILALERYFTEPSDRLLEDLYQAVGTVLQSSLLPHPLSQDQRLISRYGAAQWIIQKEDLIAAATAADSSALSFDGQKIYREIRVEWPAVTHGGKTIRVPIRLPLDSLSGEVGEFSVAQLITKFHVNSSSPASSGSNGIANYSDQPSGLMVMLHSVLADRRVLFMGNNQSNTAAELSRYVLAFCSLFSPALPDGGVINRVFPYSSLGNSDAMLQLQNGYIAGVLNPAFRLHEDWWDVLCDIGTGKVTQSPRLKAQSAYGNRAGAANANHLGGSYGSNGEDVKESALVRSDNEFMHHICQMIAGKASDFAIKRKFTRYIQQFIELAAWQCHQRWLNSGPLLAAENSKLLFGPRSAAADAMLLAGRYCKRIDAWLQSTSCIVYRQHWRSKIDHRRHRCTIELVNSPLIPIGDSIPSHCDDLMVGNEDSCDSIGKISHVWSVDDQWDLARQVARLRSSTLGLDPNDLERLLMRINRCLQCREDAEELLSLLMSQEEVGLLGLAHLFYHPRGSVKQLCLRLFQTIGSLSKRNPNEPSLIGEAGGRAGKQ